MINEILDTLQKKGLLEIHTECKTVKNNIKSTFFVLDNAYDSPKQEKTDKVAAKADNLLVGQDEVSEKKKNDKISAPQIISAENVKSEEVYDSYTEAYYKMIKNQEKEEKLKKQKEEKRREELRRQREEMQAQLKNDPVLQELMNWEYK